MSPATNAVADPDEPKVHEFSLFLGTFLEDLDGPPAPTHFRKVANAYEYIAQSFLSGSGFWEGQHNLVSCLMADIRALNAALDSYEAGSHLCLLPPANKLHSLQSQVLLCREVAEAIAERIEDDNEQSEVLDLFGIVFGALAKSIERAFDPDSNHIGEVTL